MYPSSSPWTMNYNLWTSPLPNDGNYLTDALELLTIRKKTKSYFYLRGRSGRFFSCRLACSSSNLSCRTKVLCRTFSFWFNCFSNSVRIVTINFLNVLILSYRSSSILWNSVAVTALTQQAIFLHHFEHAVFWKRSRTAIKTQTRCPGFGLA